MGQWSLYLPTEWTEIIEVAVLYFFWVTILQCWRTGRPLVREPKLWVGLTLALIPPVTELSLFIYFWEAPPVQP